MPLPFTQVFVTYSQNQYHSPARFVEELCEPFAALVLEDKAVTLPVVEHWHDILQHGPMRQRRAVLSLVRSLVVHADTQPPDTVLGFRGLHLLAGLVPHITSLMMQCTEPLSNDATLVLNTFLDSRTSLRTAFIKGVAPLAHRAPEDPRRVGSRDRCLQLLGTAVRDMSFAEPVHEPYHHRLNGAARPRRTRRRCRLEGQALQALHNARDCHLLPELPCLLEMPRLALRESRRLSAGAPARGRPPGPRSASRWARHGGWRCEPPPPAPLPRQATGSAFRNVTRSETRERAGPSRPASWPAPAPGSGTSPVALLLQQCDAVLPAFCSPSASPYPSTPFRPHADQGEAQQRRSPVGCAETEDTYASPGPLTRPPMLRSASLHNVRAPQRSPGSASEGLPRRSLLDSQALASPERSASHALRSRSHPLPRAPGQSRLTPLADPITPPQALRGSALSASEGVAPEHTPSPGAGPSSAESPVMHSTRGMARERPTYPDLSPLDNARSSALGHSFPPVRAAGESPGQGSLPLELHSRSPDSDRDPMADVGSSLSEFSNPEDLNNSFASLHYDRGDTDSCDSGDDSTDPVAEAYTRPSLDVHSAEVPCIRVGNSSPARDDPAPAATTGRSDASDSEEECVGQGFARGNSF